QPLVTLSMDTKKKQTRKLRRKRENRYQAARRQARQRMEVESAGCQKQVNEQGSTNQIADQVKQPWHKLKRAGKVGRRLVVIVRAYPRGRTQIHLRRPQLHPRRPLVFAIV